MKNIAAFIIILSSIFGLVTKVSAQIAVQITVAPPVIQVYDQPECPVDGYIWTPGYWAYGNDGYYWVQGVWMEPTEVGFLWTPGYWDFDGGYYGWHRGYWGDHVGYYGGVNYGYGYNGSGYGGGRWEGRHFHYNTEVSHINSSRNHNTYSDRSVSANNTSGRSSFHNKGGSDSQRGAPHKSAENKPVKTSESTHGNANRTQEHTAPQQHNMQQQRTEPQQHNNQQQHTAPQQHNMQQQRTEPQQHNMQQQHTAPQQHNMQQQHTAPQQHNAPQQHSGPPQGGGGRGNSGEGKK